MTQRFFIIIISATKINQKRFCVWGENLKYIGFTFNRKGVREKCGSKSIDMVWACGKNG